MGSGSSSLRPQSASPPSSEPVRAPAPPPGEERLPAPGAAAAEHRLPVEAAKDDDNAPPPDPHPAPILAGNAHVVFDVSLANPLDPQGSEEGLLHDGLFAREASSEILDAARQGLSLANLPHPHEQPPHGRGAVVRTYQFKRRLELRPWMAAVRSFGPSMEPLPADAGKLCAICLCTLPGGPPLRQLHDRALRGVRMSYLRLFD